MVYSLMNLKNSSYVSLHGEQVIRDSSREEKTEGGRKRYTGADRLTKDVVREVAEVTIKDMCLLLDFSHIRKADEETLRVLGHALQMWKQDNDIYLFHVDEMLKSELEHALLSGEISYHTETEANGESCIAIYRGGERLSSAQCEERRQEIQKEDLLILMHESSKGKYFDIERLLADNEHCLYYFFYLLAMELEKTGICPLEGSDREWYRITPENEAGVYIAENVGKYMGLGVVKRLEKETVQECMNYIAVRDVIHMSAELDRIIAITTRKGASLKAGACLVDIYTGVGSRNYRVSLHTVDTQNGLISRLRQKWLEP